MEKLRKEFPVLRNGIYANTAVYGPMYESLLDWRQEHDLDFLIHGSDMRSKALQVISETRDTVGRFFNCNRERVALVNNFSIALNMLLEGLNPKKKVLLLKGDYPSLNWAFENRDFDIEYVQMTYDLEDVIYDLIAKKGIDVLALSLVQWVDGFSIDRAFLKRLKIDFPNLFIVADGTQFCGSASFDFDASGIDVLGASAYKWLLAGYGNGFMLFSDEVRNNVNLRTIGFNAANGDLEKKNKIRFAKLFEPGHLSSLNFGSLKFSMDYFVKIGMDAITLHNQQLAEKAKSAFLQLGLLDEKFSRRIGHSTIFNIKVDNEVYRKLESNSVHCAQRGDGVRLSFHFYNNEKDVDDIVKILKTTR
ncbi:aminotransferase class V-fold PLP-dependent enzyme [Maribacter confluentis]|uniref:Aminotransferase class V-fold PLP-dependent enzyme n=1 Tax=Maribacter confluentis TaxID=1656093 RepID=A0ABT8RME7_9FLAO|nr:aminotransferase class V-fold PLP-dependent enzyme [Maribacter confluentis]MDO1512095.1 aminotransferase class V-fold PLP-dependent enzyme [Maribacter confluentis]